MLAELSLKLKTEQGTGFWHSSLFQGALMERVNSSYAAKMHETGLHPYSQCLITDRDKNVEWKIRTFDNESYQGILEPWLSPDIASVKLIKHDITFDISGRSLVTKNDSELLNRFYSGDTERRIRVAFDTPTAFKHDNRYVFMPDIGLIFGSLMRKYSASSGDLNMSDDETLQYIVEHTDISSYRLRSTTFPLEGVKIPSFMGEVTFRFTGTDTMARYARLLLEYGEFSGVGIKCGIGMGAMRIIRGGRDER